MSSAAQQRSFLARVRDCCRLYGDAVASEMRHTRMTGLNPEVAISSLAKNQGVAPGEV